MKATQGPYGALETGGLLLLQDKTFPNIVTIVTGESLTGSWWAHPLGHEIFRLVNEVADHPDVLVSKLLDGKITFVHRRLWPPLLAVAMAGEAWQTAGLSGEAQLLLEQVERAGNVVSSGAASKELECRLLVHGNQIHTESGKHQTRLESWQAWALRAGCNPDQSAAQGRAVLEAAVCGLGGSVERLPWHRFKLKSTRRGRSTKRKSSHP
ncbi:MAG: hypothetical protein ACHRXM_11285 [Isosphaerales bacterium]